MSNKGTIKNLNVIIPSMDFSGQLNDVIAAENSGVIENVHVVVETSITIKTPKTDVTNHYYGGLVGKNKYGQIISCSFQGRIETADNCVFNGPNVQCLGGIAGCGGEIRACSVETPEENSTYSSIRIGSTNKVPFYVGGIVGEACSGRFRCIRCY